MHYQKYVQQVVNYIKWYEDEHNTNKNWANDLLLDLISKNTHRITPYESGYQIATENINFKISLLIATPYNYDFWNNKQSELLLETNDREGLALMKVRELPLISESWVFYDQFGNKNFQNGSNEYDNSKYDSLALMQKNILRKNPLKISPNKVFYEGYDRPISSKVTWIYEYERANIKRYFLTYQDMVNYVTSFVKQSIVKLG